MPPDPAANPSSVPDLDLPAPGPLLFLPLLFFQAAAAGDMDLSKVGEKLFSSIRSTSSLGLLTPPSSDRPEVPARAAAAAAVARALAGIPPHQRINLPSSSDELISIYGTAPQGQERDELEEDFYSENFDPVKYLLENIPSEGYATYFDEQSTLRLAQLDKIAERLSRHVMEHHEKMVKGMQLVMELEQDLKVANVICRNGRRHITSSMNEVSRDLVVHNKSKKKQALLDMLPILAELRLASSMENELETFVENGNYCQAFLLLPEYLQILENYSELSAIQEMSRGVEAWLARTVQKLDSHLLSVCQNFKEESYITAVDAYALMGDVNGLAEKIQSFFMQEVLSQTHSILKDIVQEEVGSSALRSRFTYSDLCVQIPESRFRQCLLKTLDALFSLMCSYFSIMNLQPQEKDLEPQTSSIDKNQTVISHGSMLISCDSTVQNGNLSALLEQERGSDMSTSGSGVTSDKEMGSNKDFGSDGGCSTPVYNSPFYQLRKDAMAFVTHTLEKGRKNLWQLTTSRISVLLSSSAVCSTSTYQFLKNYEDLNTFILAGEAFSGVKAAEFRQKLRTTCESYIASFHRQNVYALKMVMEKESWAKLSAEAQVISLAGLIGDGAPLIAPSFNSTSLLVLDESRSYHPVDSIKQKDGFASWLSLDCPFSLKLASSCKESPRTHLNGLSNLADGHVVHRLSNDPLSVKSNTTDQFNGSSSVIEDENEDLLADFIDEDSQLPSRLSKPVFAGANSHWNAEEISSQTGSSLCLLRMMDKYARLMHKLEIVNLELFKGMCQLFGIFYHYVFETFGHYEASQNGKSIQDSLPSHLKTALSKILQDCDQWIRTTNASFTTSSPGSLNAAFSQMEVMPTAPANTTFGHAPGTSFGLKERCAGVETISLVASVLQKSKAHLQTMLLQHNAAVVDFFTNLVDSIPYLVEHIHKTTARMLLHINGYADKVANAKWEVKELGLEHNGYVDLLLGEFKHYKTRLAHGGISKEFQDLLLEYGLENVAEILIEGLSRVKRCTDEGRVLMSLDLQVLINGLQHFVPINVKPKLQIVETFIKAYYLPETEYVHWARSHPEFTKSQVVGLVNLVATMKGWKRKSRLDIIERIESGN